MHLWKNAQLSNDPSNILFDIILSTAIPLTYLPQLRFLTSRFAKGLSPYYLLSTCMLSTTLLTEALCFAAYVYPSPTSPTISQIREGKLRGARAFGSMAGVFQIGLLWLFSCISLGIYVSKEGLSIAVVAFLHAAVTLGIAMGVALPKPRPSHMGEEILCAVIGMVGAVCGPLSLVVGFVMQIWEFKIDGLGAMNQGSLGLQALVFGAVAWRWFSRLGKPELEGWNRVEGLSLRRRSEYLWCATGTVYRWGFLGWNLGLWAAGCGLLFGVCVGMI